MSDSAYRICRTCVMDTSDPSIKFDESGVCDHCDNFSTFIDPQWTKDRHSDALHKLSKEIKASRNKGAEFDCIIGLSGGLDSSYAALLAVNEMGLRPLLVHVDAGWNTDQAVGNIERLVEGLNLDLFTEVIHWPSVRDMQLAFLRSGIPDQDLVQDAAFFSALYRYARKYKIRHVITGSNYSTECCREPEEWGGYLGIDKTLFSDIWSKFGSDRKVFESFPLTDILKYKLVYQKLLGMRVHHPLNLTSYAKAEAERELSNRFDWKPFKHKHHESRFTRFYEDFWLRERFGFDKRRAHFSSLIMTGQMSRDAALERLRTSEMGSVFLKKEFGYIANKLEISEIELNHLFDMKKTTYKDFRNKRSIIRQGARLSQAFFGEKRHFK